RDRAPLTVGLVDQRWIARAARRAQPEHLAERARCARREADGEIGTELEHRREATSTSAPWGRSARASTPVVDRLAHSGRYRPRARRALPSAPSAGEHSCRHQRGTAPVISNGDCSAESPLPPSAKSVPRATYWSPWNAASSESGTSTSSTNVRSASAP